MARSLIGERHKSSKTKENKKLNNSFQSYFNTFSFQDDVLLSFNGSHFLLVLKISNLLFLLLEVVLAQSNMNVIDGRQKWGTDKEQCVKKNGGFEEEAPVEERVEAGCNYGHNYSDQENFEQILLGA